MSFNFKVDDFHIDKKKIQIISAWVDPEFQREQEKLGNVVSKKPEPVLITCSKKIKLNGRSIEISFNPDSENEIQKLIPTINDRLNYIEANEDKIISSIIEEILELKNKHWLSEKEKPYSINDFSKKLGKINSIVFTTSSNTSIYLNDNNLFFYMILK